MKIIEELKDLIDELDHEASDLARAGLDASGIRSVRGKLKALVKRHERTAPDDR